ncbi:MAG: hypothetical protein HZB26_01570 [Candidatus Hydrogenedentes bacterium]|nr:hypothetical protein [Candidatus Hydrogenedentota bacterium]
MSTLALCLIPLVSLSATRQDHYYAYPTVEDSNGVIAPWYSGLNGQLDFRVRIAAETLKRYPWAAPPKSQMPAPEYVFNGTWRISPAGDIEIPDLRDWDNGDLGQRAAYVFSSWVDYYRYSGDPAAIAHVTYMADYLLGYCLTPPNHPWPGFLISVPTKGKPYGQCNPQGMIQLDIAAETGLALLRAYQMTGNERWFEACKHWGDQLAIHRNNKPGMPLWNRYANPADTQWDDHMTGGVVFLLTFFDELIRLGYSGEGGIIAKARDDGRAWLRDELLPKWTVDDTWGRNYWDWPDPVQAENVTEFAARYLIEHPDVFPNWRNDTRNVLSLFLNRTSVANESKGDVYSGAWAYPESSGCCGRSLWYGPMEIATALAQYGVAELARRQQILATYDAHETGMVEDHIDGGVIVARSWFKITHPMPLKHVLGTIAWLPEVFGANRENHIVRSSAVVNRVVYGKGRIEYSTFDAPSQTLDVLRLAYRPAAVSADGAPLELRPSLEMNGLTLRELSQGDYIVTIRHDGKKRIVIEGPDPQEARPASELAFDGTWAPVEGKARAAAAPGAAFEHRFTGNQVRLVGRVGPDGGLADVYLDGAKQRVPVDCWNPAPRAAQVLYYRNGLPEGEHTLRVAARGAGNAVSKGANVCVDEVQWSAATGAAGYGVGGGPKYTQRMICGYNGRTDYIDSQSNAWRPCTEWASRTGALTDVVQKTWWTQRRRLEVANTPDPELYRYGIHAPEFWVNVTVAPGAYHVRLKFMESFELTAAKRAVTVLINGEERVTNMDVAATAGGQHRAVDLVFNGVLPNHGVIELRFRNPAGEAMVQAIEVGPGDGGTGATPVPIAPTAPEKKVP